MDIKALANRFVRKNKNTGLDKKFTAEQSFPNRDTNKTFETFGLGISTDPVEILNNIGQAEDMKRRNNGLQRIMDRAKVNEAQMNAETQNNLPLNTSTSKALSSSIKNIDNQKLKYSQKRGKGCTDCSAFTQKVFKDTYGKDIGGWTGTQSEAGTGIKPGLQKYGDLVFFDTKDGRGLDVSHVGIDNGDNTFTHFSSTNGGGVKISPYDGYYPVKKVRRVI